MEPIQEPIEETTSDIQSEEPKNNKEIKDLSPRDIYYNELAKWANEAAVAQMFPNYMMMTYTYYLQMSMIMQLNQQWQMMQTNRPVPAQAQAQNPNQAPPTDIRLSMRHGLQHFEAIRRFGGRQLLVAPFWKRGIAEFLDFLICFLLKLSISYLLHYYYDMRFNKALAQKTLLENNIIMSIPFVAMEVLLAPSYDIVQELVITKILICMYELLFIVFNNGATPGKCIMKIRILYVEAIVPLQQYPVYLFIFQIPRQPLWALIYPGDTPSIVTSVFRVFVKNFVVAVLFPLFIVLIFLRNNRTTYDVLTKTIVVEFTPVGAPYAALRPYQLRNVR